VVPYGTEVPIEPGAQARLAHTVTSDDTAVSLGSGDVPVLGTSRLIAWCEQATLEVLRPHDSDGITTVAMRVHLDHLRAVALDCEVTTIATLERIEGRRYVFVVSALSSSGQLVAEGRIVRVEVETESFMASACGNAG